MMTKREELEIEALQHIDDARKAMAAGDLRLAEHHMNKAGDAAHKAEELSDHE